MHSHSVPRVLIVEDDSALRLLLEMTLDESGCELATAKNGAEALAVLDVAPPDVIVLDLNMPVMDGVHFYHCMKQRGLNVPTLLLSGDHNAPLMASELGVPASMSKPVDTDALTRAVFELTDGAQREPAPRR